MYTVTVNGSGCEWIATGTCHYEGCTSIPFKSIYGSESEARKRMTDRMRFHIEQHKTKFQNQSSETTD